MTIANFEIIEGILILIIAAGVAVAGTAFAVFIESKMSKSVYAKNWDEGLVQHLRK